MDNKEKEMLDLSVESKYRKILIAAKRSKQIQRGAKPRVVIPGAKPTRLAMEEVDNGLINYEITQDVE